MPLFGHDFFLFFGHKTSSFSDLVQVAVQAAVEAVSRAVAPVWGSGCVCSNTVWSQLNNCTNVNVVIDLATVTREAKAKISNRNNN